MRLSHYLRKQFIEASKEAFSESELILFGSRVDDSKKGGDFDIAVCSAVSKEAFNKGKIHFFKYLILRDLDLAIDLVHYNLANDLLKQEIDKGIKL